MAYWQSSNMLPHPHTPPDENSWAPATSLQGHDTAAWSASHAQYPPEQLATPTSNIDMVVDGMDELSGQGGGSKFSGSSDEEEEEDEDEDMDDAEGGVTFTTSALDTHALNAEMDELDAELMGPENMAQLWAEAYQYAGDEQLYLAHHHYALNDAQVQPPIPAQTDDDGPGEFSGLVVEDVPMQGGIGISNLPTIVSQVPLQLQVQDGQEHGVNTEVADELQGALLDNNSITSNLIAHFPQTSPVQPIMFPDASAAEPAALQASDSSMSSNDDVDDDDFLSALTAQSLFATAQPVPPITNYAPSDVVDHVLAHPSGWGTAHAVNNTNAAATGPSSDDGMSSADTSFNEDFHVIADDGMDNANNLEVEDQYNLSVRNFLQRWGEISGYQRHHERSPSLASLAEQRRAELQPMEAKDLRGDRCDLQRINWRALGVTRAGAKDMRRKTYRNYTNLRYDRQWPPHSRGAELADDENFFRFRSMDFSHKVHLSHFQLRNLIACPTPDHIYYAGRSKVLHWTPTRQEIRQRPSVAMNLTDPSVQPLNAFLGNGIQISTLTVAHDILVAGGFCGEYGIVNLRSQNKVKHMEGLIIDHSNSITNHVQVQLSRQSYLPQAVFASNDAGVRILDINTNKFISERMYEDAVNCSAISPDQRLRVLVGDTRQVMICHADTGEILQSLDGHRDFGFACDWADDGWTVATGNQDMLIKIWDARKWTTTNGHGNPVATIAAEMAGVRKLKFSPLGSGKKVLLAAEPADIISVIDASTYNRKQTLSFFGEIGGVDFTNDGQNIWVANCDDMWGGLMEFERCGLADYGQYHLQREQARNSSRQRQHTKSGSGSSFVSARAGSMQHAAATEGYDWITNDAELNRHSNVRGSQEMRARRAAALGTNMGFF